MIAHVDRQRSIFGPLAPSFFDGDWYLVELTPFGLMPAAGSLWERVTEGALS